MLNLREESLYLQGARDILLRLIEDYDMYLIPSVKCRIKDNEFRYGVDEQYAWFPLSNTKMRKIVGKSLCNTLIHDRESLVRFLNGSSELEIKDIKRDKKGNVAEVKLRIN